MHINYDGFVKLNRMKANLNMILDNCGASSKVIDDSYSIHQTLKMSLKPLKTSIMWVKIWIRFQDFFRGLFLNVKLRLQIFVSHKLCCIPIENVGSKLRHLDNLLHTLLVRKSVWNSFWPDCTCWGKRRKISHYIRWDLSLRPHWIYLFK